MTWASTAPYSNAPKDRWLRITWAAKHYGIDRDTLLAWAKNGAVEARQTPQGAHWQVSEQSLRLKLFGKDTDVRTR